MLGYRTLFSVDGDSEVILEQSLREFRRWLRSKRNRQYDGDLLEYNTPLRFSEDAAALLLREEQPDGSRALRATLTEVNEVGRWTTRLTVSTGLDRRPWIWVDVDGPAERPDGSGKRQWTSTPNLAKALLSDFVAFDGSARLDVRPQRAFPDDVDGLIDMVCDPDRRGLLFLAGTDPSVPLGAWMDSVADILRDTAGLAAAYVLDPEATRVLLSHLTASHGVMPGTIRTYRPGADPASELDGRRHRILGRSRLESDDPQFLRRLLGWRAREAALEQPLPRAALRLDSRLEVITNHVLLDRLAVTTTEPPTARSAQPGMPPAEVSARPKGMPAESEAETRTGVVREAEFLTQLAALLRETTGAEVEPSDAETVLANLATLATASSDIDNAQADLRIRLDELSERVIQTELDLREVRVQLEDEQLDHAQTTQDLTRAESERDQLRLELNTLGHGDIAWSVSGDEAVASLPESLTELLQRLPELGHVRFTGDLESARALEEHDPVGTWAAKTWSALEAVNGYAESKAEGLFSGNVDTYLQSPPPGRPGYSRQRHARDESEPVKSNDRFHDARMFAVPTAVEPSGQVFMGAHFKIAQFGMISPRLHYFDATAIDGTIYVGYIGPHLPTKKTN